MQLKDVLELLLDAAVLGLIIEFGRLVSADTKSMLVNRQLMSLDYAERLRAAARQRNGGNKPGTASDDETDSFDNHTPDAPAMRQTRTHIAGNFWSIPQLTTSSLS